MFLTPATYEYAKACTHSINLIRHNPKFNNSKLSQFKCPIHQETPINPKDKIPTNYKVSKTLKDIKSNAQTQDGMRYNRS